ncbi:NAD(P)-binding protein [Natranaerofaba carboxydovora]|uniref:NAD(P)-binding protein n=1 Tax=Natranaerofaba carboxydovora TaxID=2742683 RepID=UPI001F12FEF7|nr:NAD(P)-binding protein [Natranaerofaba carboxydovora]UMZ74941.1 hypothetical protein ACONDI_02545 [Natranaerofaba carboxydovora]
MKVAILGAGLSGLSAAFILEKYGINPIIFEKRNQVGDKTPNAEIHLSILTKPINDCFEYFYYKFGIELKPLNKIKKHTFVSENNQTTIKGNLGCTFLKGDEPVSLENQLKRKLKSQIIYNSSPSYNELLDNFSHIVLATGESGVPAKMFGYYDSLFSLNMIGANVRGNFTKDNIIAWRDKNIFSKGYGLLTPISNTKASLMAFVPDYLENDPRTILEMFYYKVCNTLGQSIEIEEKFDEIRELTNLSPFSKVDNTYLVGNCLGTTLPIPGFDIFKAILTGAFSAYDIANKADYEKSLQPLRKKVINLNNMKKTMENIRDDQFDMLVSALKLAPVRSIFHTKKDILSIAGQLMD